MTGIEWTHTESLPISQVLLVGSQYGPKSHENDEILMFVCQQKDAKQCYDIKNFGRTCSFSH